jgi:hypothetical protein
MTAYPASMKYSAKTQSRLETGYTRTSTSCPRTEIINKPNCLILLSALIATSMYHTSKGTVLPPLVTMTTDLPLAF